MDKKKCSTIGGQAVIEGVMMRGTSSMATAVRDENGKIVVESQYVTPTKEKNFLFKTPFLRGIFNFVSTMVDGMRTLLRSGEVFDGEEEPTKVEKWLAKKTKINIYSIVMAFAIVIGIALSIGLFFVLPYLARYGVEQLITYFTSRSIESYGAGVVVAMHFFEGLIRIVIFIAYISATRLMKDVKRTYMYHGAEHKTISCYEHGLDLTVENAQKMTTVHDRCGTTFMFIIMVVSVLIFSLTSGWTNGLAGKFWIELALRLLLLPVVSGVSYEILKFNAKHDGWFFRAMKAPGLWLQKLTTCQPTDDMVEVAIVAFKTVLEMDNDNNTPVQFFDTKLLYKKCREQIELIVKKVEADQSDVDWIICQATGLKRDQLTNTTHIRKSEFEKAKEFAQKRASGMPLWQVFGVACFYGYDIKINQNVLCPRPETELLAEQVIKRSNDQTKVLDMCVGSGCIAIAVAKESGASVVGVDKSNLALEVAKENIEKYNLQDKISLLQSDMFQNVTEKFDIIVSNPPYIPSEDIKDLDNEVKNFEPLMALDGGKDGLDFYRIIASNAKEFLNEKGIIALECGINQAQEIVELLVDFDCTIIKDLQGIDRIIIGEKK